MDEDLITIAKSFEAFAHDVRSGNTNILELLGIRGSDFENEKDLPDELKLDDGTDLAYGMYERYLSWLDMAFGVFLWLEYTTGERGKYTLAFRGNTDDARAVHNMVDVMVTTFGKGTVELDDFGPFEGIDKTFHIALDCDGTTTRGLCGFWHVNELTLALLYDRDQMLSLVVMYNPHLELDTSERKRSILELMENDMNALLQAVPDIVVDRRTEPFVDFAYGLTQPELNVFDMAYIRQYAPLRDASLNCRTDLCLLYERDDLPLRDKSQVVEMLMKVYGQDSFGNVELSIKDIDELAAGGGWEGFEWRLNDEHELVPGDVDTYAYAVRIVDHDDDGMMIYILNFDWLWKQYSRR